MTFTSAGRSGSTVPVHRDLQMVEASMHKLWPTSTQTIGCLVEDLGARRKISPHVASDKLGSKWASSQIGSHETRSLDNQTCPPCACRTIRSARPQLDPRRWRRPARTRWRAIRAAAWTIAPAHSRGASGTRVMPHVHMGECANEV